MLINDKDAIMKHAKHYKLRSLLKMIRLSLKLDRKKVSKSLYVSVDTIYYLEHSLTMRWIIPKPLLEGICKLYGIDYQIIHDKMMKEHKDYHRLCAN